jgi:hypothetical protein
LLNITGTQFNSNCTVQVDGNNCPIVSVSYTQIVCQVPSNVITILYYLLILIINLI